MVQTPIESENFLFLNWNRFKEFQCSGASIFFVSLKKYICQPSRDFYKEENTQGENTHLSLSKHQYL